MELYFGDTYWDKTVSKEDDIKFEKIKKNEKTEILIVGGGMSGTLAAYILSNRNHKVIIVEKDQVAKGSSTANTGLLQFCSDIMLSDLIEQIGEKKAVLFYEMCLKSMDDLTAINDKLAYQTDYRSKSSIYYSSNIGDKNKLEKEYKTLKKYNFPVEYISNDELIKDYNLDKAFAIKTFRDADVNPYKFIKALTRENKKNGVKYFENTQVNLDSMASNQIYTKEGYKIEFKNIILATGYTNIYPIIKDKAQINRTYAISSKPFKKLPWKEDVMFWETKNPYLYFRTTTDKRIIAGGLDEEINKLEKNIEDLKEKTEKIAKEINDLFDGLNLEVENRWNALFGISTDNLPFIGADPIHKNKYYLLGYEGNGTCYSMAGSRIIADLIENKKNPYSHIVRLDR
ncbi:NAD(P)/FAD-dependent oxidoreductase [Senegalia sp. (in: firmicutes)]|uniref:NAD(P)/FAD-dependent oxidoreductase n=1 Tax=Senegalia sp. (in: firmicutes) TaxID=1924098 RepID=UPI003F9D4AE8